MEKECKINNNIFTTTFLGQVHFLDNIIIEDFSWSHCGGSDDILKIKSFTVEPDTVHLPGMVQVSFDVDVSQEITRPVDVRYSTFRSQTSMVGNSVDSHPGY